MLHAKFQDTCNKTFGSGIYQTWAWWPSWSCDLNHLYKLLFPFIIEPPHKIWLVLAMRFQRSSLKMVDGRQRTPENGYTMSSPCEPDGSGELNSK